MDLDDIFEAFRRTGRKGGVVAFLLGAIILAGGISLAQDAKKSSRHFDGELEIIAAFFIVGGVATVGGLKLIVEGDSARYEPPPERAQPRDPLDSVPLPYALCLQCPRVVKNWHVTTCTQCGSDLVNIRSEEDEQWARETLAARNGRPVARPAPRKAPRAPRRTR
ncbi:C-type lectin domain-containing protein [Vitiosangium sp. GDMCC 1.1324]|uniref:C-type lectin domain-containing protein n=1 Tax=Vitiosangium sp. (strain GDMCC 1.1324) TaxID=2138576 RepID=UPI000D3CB54E|nr:C-type lectin domain-containing protein [Vitiosangium sp. GDMCC 1.1324]PTL77606.1 hypothetical protein DAT35_43200 [Vitiosangium sp. GDMCC 1.1324]